MTSFRSMSGRDSRASMSGSAFFTPLTTSSVLMPNWR